MDSNGSYSHVYGCGLESAEIQDKYVLYSIKVYENRGLGVTAAILEPDALAPFSFPDKHPGFHRIFTNYAAHHWQKHDTVSDLNAAQAIKLRVCLYNPLTAMHWA